MIRSLAVVTALAALPACGGTTSYVGQASNPVVGTPPPPPPVVEAPKPPPKVEVRNNRIELAEKVQFDYDKATINPVSFSLLDEVVKTFKDHPQIKKVSIDGFASSDGDAAHNRSLSDDRAKAVMAYLVAHGVEQPRLTAKGHGSDSPIADNSTAEGREKNRRVELNILEQDVTTTKVEIDPQTGKEKVVDTKTTDENKAPTAEPAAMTKPATQAAPTNKGVSQ